MGRAIAPIAVLFVLLTPHQSWSQAIDPGHERDAMALIAPLGEAEEVRPNVHLAGVQVQRDRIVFLLRAKNTADAATVQALAPAVSDVDPIHLRVTFQPSGVPALLDAQTEIAARVQRNDQGVFAASSPTPDENSAIPWKQTAPFEWPGTVAPFAYASALLWLVCLAMVLRWRPRFHADHRSRGRVALVAVAVASAAMVLRELAPFWTMHSNGHAEHDMAMAMRMGGVASQPELSYGPAWVTAQQAVVWCLGSHRQSVAHASAIAGSLSCAVIAVAGWSLTRRVLPAAMAGLFMATVPAVGRVAHSESPFVFGQLLFALTVLQASGRGGRVRWLGIWVPVVLLAWGHPLGIGYAVAAAALAGAVVGADSTLIPGLRRHFVGLFGAAVLAWVPWQILHHDVLGRRVDLPFTRYLEYSLGNTVWASGVWVSPFWLALGVVGAAGLMHATPRAHRLSVAFAAVAGAGLLIRVGTLPVACTTDALRYQSLWAAPMATLVALAWVWQPHNKLGTGAIRATTTGLAIAAVLHGGAGRSGWTVLDAQGARTAALLDAVQDRAGDVPFLSGTTNGMAWPHVYAPVGRVDGDGPDLVALGFDVAKAICSRQGSLPAGTLVAADLDCPAQDAGECNELRTWESPLAVELKVARLTATDSPTVRPEFLPSTKSTERLRLGPATCP